MLKDNLAKKLTFGMKRSDLAKKSGVSEELLYRIIHGKTPNPGVYTIEKIADALSVSIDELLGREEFFNKFIINHDDALEVPPGLFTEALEMLKAHLEKLEVKSIKIKNCLYILRSICDYAVKHNAGKLNKDFAAWIINNHMT